MGAARTTRGSRGTGPAEDRAQPAEGRSRRTGGGSGPTTSIRSTGGALTDRMTAETLRVRGTCDLDIHMYRYDRAEVVLTLFGSIGFRRFNQRIKGPAASVVASSFELNKR